MTKSKMDNNKKNNKLIKFLYGLIIAIITVTYLFIVSETEVIGKVLGFVVYFFITAFALYEFTRIFPLPNWAKYYFPFFAIFSFFFPFHNVVDWFNIEQFPNQYIIDQYEYKMFGIPGLGFGVIAILCLIPFFFENKLLKTKIQHYFMTYFVTLMITIVGKCLLLLNRTDVLFIIAIFIGTAVCDSFAYFGGMLLGNKIFKNKKLAPKISPNKTIEGAIIGYLVSWLIMFCVFMFLEFDNLNIDSDLLIIFVPLTLPIVAILGDLLFSWIKRKLRVKDFSNLIPSHGGILDRIDSILFVSFVFIPLFMVI